MTRQQRDQGGIEELPTTLSGALERFEQSDFMRSVLGDHIFEYLLKAKREECDEYDRMVSRWELDKLLSMTLQAMAESEDAIRAEMEAEGIG